MTEETIEVTAEVIGEETAITPAFTPAIIDAQSYLEDRSAKVKAHMEPYEGMTEEGLRDLNKREVYDLRADVNKVIKAMKSEVSTIKKEHMKPFDAFKAQADAVIKQAEDAHKLLDRVYKDKEAFDRADRRAQLEEEYAACAGDFAKLVPFEAVLNEEWLGDTAWKSGKPMREVADIAGKAVEGYETLRKKELKHKTDVVSHYCETLDLMGALQLEDELNEQDRQRAEFEERQRQAEAVKAARQAEQAEQAAQAEALAAERQLQRAETEAEAFAQTAAGAIEREDPNASAVAAGPSVIVAEKTGPEVFAWHLAIDSDFTATKEQAQQVAATLKDVGITGTTIKCKGVVNG